MSSVIWFLVFFIGALVYKYRRQPALGERLRIKAVLPGAIVAGTLALFALVDSALRGRAFPVQFGLLLTPVFSAGVAYAIAKHALFDIDRIIRQSVVYAMLSLALTGLYAGLRCREGAFRPRSRVARQLDRAPEERGRRGETASGARSPC